MNGSYTSWKLLPSKNRAFRPAGLRPCYARGHMLGIDGRLRPGRAWHSSCSQLCETPRKFQERRLAMFRFIIGALAGSLAIWLWGEELKRYATTSTRAA